MESKKEQKGDKQAKKDEEYRVQFEDKKAKFSSGGDDIALMGELLENPPLKASDLNLKVSLRSHPILERDIHYGSQDHGQDQWKQAPRSHQVTW